jgi:hypothetical protein
MGVLGKANIGGVLRDLTGDGYVNIGGVLRPITVGKINIGGVLVTSGGTVWKKYNATAVYKYVEKSTAGITTEYDPWGGTDIYTSKSLNISTGKYTLSGSYWQQYLQWFAIAGSEGEQYGYFWTNGYDNTRVAYITSATFLGDVVRVTYTLYYSEKTVSHYTRGAYIEDVISSNKNAYPENGRHTDGYWYVKQ